MGPSSIALAHRELPFDAAKRIVKEQLEASSHELHECTIFSHCRLLPDHSRAPHWDLCFVFEADIQLTGTPEWSRRSGGFPGDTSGTNCSLAVTATSWRTWGSFHRWLNPEGPCQQLAARVAQGLRSDRRTHERGTGWLGRKGPVLAYAGRLPKKARERPFVDGVRVVDFDVPHVFSCALK